MAEPTIICPECGTEIKLTESLAAPLVAAVRSELEEKIARNNSEVAKREVAIREKEAAVAAQAFLGPQAINHGLRRATVWRRKGRHCLLPQDALPAEHLSDILEGRFDVARLERNMVNPIVVRECLASFL